MIVDNTTYVSNSPGDDRPVTFSKLSGKLYLSGDGIEEINQTVFDSTEYFRLNVDEVEKLRNLLIDYERLKQLVQDHFPEDLL